MSRFRRSLALAKSSWAILRSDPKLATYPIISAIAVAILAALIVAPFYAIAGLPDGDNYRVSDIVLLLVLYTVCYTAIFFCSTALGFEVKQKMEGVRAPISGWHFARSRIFTIVGYALIAASVGVGLRLLADRGRIGGQIAAAIGGAVWSIMTFLVVPVLVSEKIGPIAAIKRSGGLLKKTWGEQILGNAGIGLVTGLITLVVALIGGGLIFAAVASSVTVLIVLAIAVTALAIGLVIVVSSALDAIYRMAVYRYAIGEQSPQFAASELLPNAFEHKA